MNAQGLKKYPRQGVNTIADSREKLMIGVQDDAHSDALFANSIRDDARLIGLVEAWAGLPNDVKDRIAALVESVAGCPRGA